MGYEILQADGGVLSTLLVTAKENSSFTVMHSRMEKGASAPIHYHERDHEAFYVLSGKVRFVSGSESQYLVEAGPGTIVVCPPYCTRSFQAISEAILIVINYPSGPAEEFLRDMTSLPAMPPQREDMKRFASRYGIHVMKAYDGKDIKPSIANLSRDSPLVVGELCFSHGSEDDNDDGDKITLWLFACNTNNKLPHSLPIRSKTGPDVFYVGHA
jgi:quercetin dioxygenase-like cupin family protein